MLYVYEPEPMRLNPVFGKRFYARDPADIAAAIGACQKDCVARYGSLEAEDVDRWVKRIPAPGEIPQSELALLYYSIGDYRLRQPGEPFFEALEMAPELLVLMNFESAEAFAASRACTIKRGPLYGFPSGQPLGFTYLPEDLWCAVRSYDLARHAQLAREALSFAR